MSAWEQNCALAHRLANVGIVATPEQAGILRRAQLTLRRWYELECGDSDNYESWAIERDDETDTPYMVFYPHTDNKSRRYRIADRENGAKRRVLALCKELGIYAYFQSDPRGPALYVSAAAFAELDPSRGVACC